jgi:hypothetical protein
VGSSVLCMLSVCLCCRVVSGIVCCIAGSMCGKHLPVGALGKEAHEKRKRDGAAAVQRHRDSTGGPDPSRSLSLSEEALANYQQVQDSRQSIGGAYITKPDLRILLLPALLHVHQCTRLVPKLLLAQKRTNAGEASACDGSMLLDLWAGWLGAVGGQHPPRCSASHPLAQRPPSESHPPIC